jgi:hypothetical protein
MNFDRKLDNLQSIWTGEDPFPVFYYKYHFLIVNAQKGHRLVENFEFSSILNFEFVFLCFT